MGAGFAKSHARPEMRTYNRGLRRSCRHDDISGFTRRLSLLLRLIFHKCVLDTTLYRAAPHF